MVEEFSPRRVSDLATNQNFQDLRKLPIEINRGKILNNVIVNAITLDTNVSAISHTLNRRPQGWVIIRKDANADVWEPTPSASPSKLINLQASSTVTLDILFF